MDSVEGHPSPFEYLLGERESDTVHLSSAPQTNVNASTTIHPHLLDNPISSHSSSDDHPLQSHLQSALPVSELQSHPINEDRVSPHQQPADLSPTHSAATIHSPSSKIKSPDDKKARDRNRILRNRQLARVSNERRKGRIKAMESELSETRRTVSTLEESIRCLEEENRELRNLLQGKLQSSTPFLLPDSNDVPIAMTSPEFPTSAPPALAPLQPGSRWCSLYSGFCFVVFLIPTDLTHWLLLPHLKLHVWPLVLLLFGRTCGCYGAFCPYAAWCFFAFVMYEKKETSNSTNKSLFNNVLHSKKNLLEQLFFSEMSLVNPSARPVPSSFLLVTCKSSSVKSTWASVPRLCLRSFAIPPTIDDLCSKEDSKWKGIQQVFVEAWVGCAREETPSARKASHASWDCQQW